MVEYVMKKSWL